MKEPRKIVSFNRPVAIHSHGDGTYYYNYDIKEIKVHYTIWNEGKAEESDKLAFEFITVTLTGEPNYKDCVQAIIRQYLTQEEEFDLINSYNVAIVDANSTSEDVAKYKEYLALLTTIKTKIKADFNA